MSPAESIGGEQLLGELLVHADGAARTPAPVGHPESGPGSLPVLAVRATSAVPGTPTSARLRTSPAPGSSDATGHHAARIGRQRSVPDLI